MNSSICKCKSFFYFLRTWLHACKNVIDESICWNEITGDEEKEIMIALINVGLKPEKACGLYLKTRRLFLGTL
jgi:hypothetical protein